MQQQETIFYLTQKNENKVHRSRKDIIMPSIESLGHDIIYKVKRLSPSVDAEKKHIRGEFRALEGMQKEGIIHYRPTGTVWRMACDEGPYLNGTDLSSFPLGFYSAGITFDFMEKIVARAKAEGVVVSKHNQTSC